MTEWLNEFRRIVGPVLNEQELEVLESRLLKAWGKSEISKISNAEDLPEKMGVSREYVHQLWESALKKIDDKLNPKIPVNIDVNTAKQNLEEASTYIDRIKKLVVMAEAAVTIGVINNSETQNLHPVTLENVPTRIFHRISNWHVKNIEDFATVRKPEIIRVQGCGIGTVKELQQCLMPYGVILKD